MICTEPARPAVPRTSPPAATRGPAGPPTGVTVFGCTRDEAALFRVLAPGFGVLPTITGLAPSEATAELALGDRCVSVGHRTPISNPTLRALSDVGVGFVSTRSIGLDHIDLRFAETVGIRVEGVTYSPDSVADYTLMLMLMAVRHARSVICRADARDFRLSGAPGRELRDLTVGVVGTGRIGSAVVDRLRGFGCRVLTHDIRDRDRPGHVLLDDLLEQSDVVTLHTPLTAGTHHLLDRRRIERLKHDAVIVNTGRGALLDTEALVSALDRGRLGGAALDVLEGEEGIFYADLREKPLPSELLARLQAMPNVLISPHTAYYTEHSVADMVGNSLAGCRDFERSRRA